MTRDGLGTRPRAGHPPSRRRLLACLPLAAALAASPAAAQETLVLYNWATYFPPDLLAEFEADTGIKVITEVFDSNEAMLANVETGVGNYDVVVPSDYMVRAMIDRGLLQPVRARDMENFRHVKPPFDSPWYDPDREYSVPNMQGTTGFLYDERQVEGGKLRESWSEFFDPRPELIGKVIAFDDPRELYQAAAHYLGIDPCTEDAAEAQRILDVLAAQKPKLAYYTSGTNPNVADPLQAAVDEINAGTVALGQAWDGEGRRMKRAVPSATYVVPEEGSAFWQDAYVVPYGAWNPENAKVFLNWIMHSEHIAAVSNYNGYTNAIAGSEAFMEPALAADQRNGLSPEFQERLRPVKSCSEAALELNARVWSRLWPRTVK